MIQISPRELAIFAITGMSAMQKSEEFESLLALVAETEPKVIVEIGAGKGGTSWAWSKRGASKLIVIDLPAGPWGGEKDLSQTFKYISENTQTSIDIILGSSANSECLAAFKERLGDSKIDFLFIDGSHSYEGVKTDFLTYSPFVRDGGIIAFHDICEHPKETECEVKKFWDELKEAAASKPAGTIHEFISEPKTWGGIGVLRK